jgi:hypothetical protein
VIAHVVLLKLKSGLSAADRQAFVDVFDRAIREIPSVRAVRVGRRVTVGATYETTTRDDADFMAVIDFDDVEGLRAYLHHPAHAELGVRFGLSLSAASVYDFEVGGLEFLASLV